MELGAVLYETEEQNFGKIGLAVWITVRGGLYFVLDCVNR
jgi:hypothetical protein